MSSVRNPAQIDMDRTEIASMYVRGLTQSQMIAAISEQRPYILTPSMLKDDITSVRDEWRARRLGAMDDWVAEQLARFDEIEREAWAAWEESRQPQRRTVQNARPGADGRPVPTGATTSTDPGKGDPRYLELIRGVIGDRCRLLGLYPTIQANVNVQHGIVGLAAQDVTRMDDGDLREEITRLAAMETIQRALLDDPRVIDQEQ